MEEFELLEIILKLMDLLGFFIHSPNQCKLALPVAARLRNAPI
jgi:hypothetical protein